MSQTNFEDQNPYLEMGRMKRELSILREALEQILRIELNPCDRRDSGDDMQDIARAALRSGGGE